MDRNLAVGLVRHVEGRRSPNRWWFRAVVIRYARDQRLNLVDVLELDDDGDHNAQELRRLAAVATRSEAAVLVTYGVRAELAHSLATDLGLRHAPAPDRPGVPGRRPDRSS
jgi:hypothetical protein